MKFAVAATLIALAAAQSDGVPQCAQKCIADAATAVGCKDTTDLACLCSKQDQVQEKASPCVLGACKPDEIANVISAAKEKCANQGSQPAGSSTGAASTPASSAPATSAPATSADDSTTVAPMSPDMSSDCGTSMESQTPAANETVPTATSVPVAGAAGLTVGAAAVALAALAAL